MEAIVRCGCFPVKVILFSVTTFHVIGTLFGAAIIQQFFETLLWSILMTSLILIPPFILLPWQLEPWIETFILFQHKYGTYHYCFYNAMLALLGSWIGAFALLLDWKVPWQVWPIPCCVGGVLGAVVNLVLGILRCGYLRLFQEHDSTKCHI